MRCVPDSVPSEKAVVEVFRAGGALVPCLIIVNVGRHGKLLWLLAAVHSCCNTGSVLSAVASILCPKLCPNTIMPNDGAFQASRMLWMLLQICQLTDLLILLNLRPWKYSSLHCCMLCQPRG